MFDTYFDPDTRLLCCGLRLSKYLQKLSPDSFFIFVERIALTECEEMKGFMQGILEQNRIAASIINRTRGSFGEKIGFMASMFGCWHKRLTRPFTDRHITYRACVDCGARKKFNTEEFRTVGPFYYPPSVKPEGV